jgi:hypothetical protein
MTPPIVRLPVILAPCAWCTPKAELDALHVAYPGLSDTCCKACSDLILAEHS